MLATYRANRHLTDDEIDQELLSLSLRRYEQVELTPWEYVQAVGHGGVLLLVAVCLVVCAFCL